MPRHKYRRAELPFLWSLLSFFTKYRSFEAVTIFLRWLFPENILIFGRVLTKFRVHRVVPPKINSIFSHPIEFEFLNLCYVSSRSPPLSIFKYLHNHSSLRELKAFQNHGLYVCLIRNILGKALNCPQSCNQNTYKLK